MLVLIERLRRRLSRLNAMANHDFCPWANRYVYWLKEPVGWFVTAMGASLLVGALLSPLGWTVAAGLAAILALGLGFPWLAIRMIRCELSPTTYQIHERQTSQLELWVHNRLPLPIIGLVVEGYLPEAASQSRDTTAGRTGVGLARVPALSAAAYRLVIKPEYRGRFPIGQPTIACSFPFGIWTARRALAQVRPVTVWPLIIPIAAELDVSGNQLAEAGSGQRPASHGDFMGVRDFRRGDSLRSIHWVQSARLDNLIVFERGGPQKQAVELHLGTELCVGSDLNSRENLAWRIRIMASLIDLSVARHLPFRLEVDGKLLMSGEGAQGRRRAWELLTDIPRESPKSEGQTRNPNLVANTSIVSTQILIDANSESGDRLPDHLVRVQVLQPGLGLRRASQHQSCLVNLDEDITRQLTQLLMEAARESYAA
ncbi:MAG TPA: DUF58 domain-containing protein [Planctomycetaceae bacterium]|nr:DUF58 domain-containing protein [Planctomycetaceae bacterium]